MQVLEANGIHIEYETHGEGYPLILIAGLGYDRWMWHKMIPYLSSQFRVIAFDNRGVGGTDKPEGPYSAWLLAQDTAALLEALGIEQAAILGHSMGGFVAQALALSRPDLTGCLILSATNFGGPRHIPVSPEALAVLTDVSGDPIARLRRGLVVSTAAGFAESHPEIIEEWLAYRMAHPIHPAGYQAQLAVGLGLLQEEACFEPRLHEITAPALILFGEEDRVVPPGNADLLARKIPNSQVKILPGCGHFYPFEAPERASAAVVEFIHHQVEQTNKERTRR